LFCFVSFSSKVFRLGDKVDLLVVVAVLFPDAVLLNRLPVVWVNGPVVCILVQFFFDQLEQLKEMQLVGVFHEDFAEALNKPSAVFGSGKMQAKLIIDVK
jgi:hypothetical protein